jgi:hypothetical protein
MDELEVRVRCLRGEEVVVPIEIKELYTSSPKNHKSITIIEAISIDGQKPLLLLVIYLGKKIMEL